MKKLRKIRLINWHRFENETLEVGDSTLISGENGAGKSTILDAVQFVVTCSKAHFNKAAQDKGKRTLGTYIRCKTGTENRPYERTGEVSAHICLEFFDEARRKPFLLGVVMDSATIEKEPNVVWYLAENMELSDDLFLVGDRVKSISVFRSTNRQIRTFAPTAREAQRLITSRFGRIDNKFFALIPKALAFKPINDIKDFVYSYVLDAKEVNIDILRENVRSYQDLLRMLEDVRARIRKLEAITEKEKSVEVYIRRDRAQEYFIARADQDISKESIASFMGQISETKEKEAALRKTGERLLAAIRDTEQLVRNLDLELNNDTGYQAFRELEKQEENLKELLSRDKAEVALLRKNVRQALLDTEELLRISERFGREDGLPRTGAAPREAVSFAWPKPSRAALLGYRQALSEIWEAEDTLSLEKSLEDALACKKELYNQVVNCSASLQLRQKEVEDRRAETEAQVQELSKRRLVYPENVSLLQKEVQAAFAKMGRTREPRILCELLEITDTSWQNAVEGYLNTQRFHILVEPEDFDLALSVYEKLRRKNRVYGAGLVNTAKLEGYEEVPAGSLAEVVTSENVYARRYVHMLLGKVQRCEKAEELKKYPTAITRECMRYQNHVASAIHPEIFRKPFIGAEAYKVQLKIKQEELWQLQETLRQMRADLQLLSSLRPLLDTDADVAVKYGLSALDSQHKHEEKLENCRRNMREIDASQNLLQKRLRLEEMKRKKQQMDDQNMDLIRQMGSCEQRVRDLEERIKAAEENLREREALVRSLFEGLGEDGPSLERDYLEKRREAGDVPMPVFKSNYERNRKANQTLRQKAEEEMKQLMRAYKAEHDFGAPENLEGYPEFLAEYTKLKNSQLLEYEDKVYRARNAAEEEFREQFLSKLQENIRQAQNEFKELNNSLKEIHFAREQYEFQHFPRKEHKKYYSMIMDDFNVMEGNSLFSGAFNEAHREVIEELFEKLTLDNEASAKTLEEYTDYRTFMDYDIKITAEDGSYMYYSKVSREKSGGETQTPFYITIAASFMQLYKGAIGGDSVGLVLMDEAFNNMDSGRMDGVLSFITHANLQLIVSCPPEKIQYIAPSLDQVLLVLKDGEMSYVEDFTRRGD